MLGTIDDCCCKHIFSYLCISFPNHSKNKWRLSTSIIWLSSLLPSVSASVNFLVKPDEKRKYDALFDQLQPVDGKLPGDKVSCLTSLVSCGWLIQFHICNIGLCVIRLVVSIQGIYVWIINFPVMVKKPIRRIRDEKLNHAFTQVRQVMMGSKLPMPILGKIWDLSDIDRDGLLDRYEFTVAMHLVRRWNIFSFDHFLTILFPSGLSPAPEWRHPRCPPTRAESGEGAEIAVGCKRRKGEGMMLHVLWKF